MNHPNTVLTCITGLFLVGTLSAQPPDLTSEGKVGMIRVGSSPQMKESRIAIVWGDRMKPPAKYPLSIVNLKDAMLKWTKIPTEVMSHVRLGSPDVNKLPILIISTEDAFDLNGSEIRNLREYIEKGGFIFADGGSPSLRQMVADIAGEREIVPVPSDHPVFRKPFLFGGPPVGNRNRLPVSESGRYPLSDEAAGLKGVIIDGRLAILYTDFYYYSHWNNDANDTYLKFGVNLIMYAIGGS
jgi:hypothetical protein